MSDCILVTFMVNDFIFWNWCELFNTKYQILMLPFNNNKAEYKYYDAKITMPFLTKNDISLICHFAFKLHR